MDEVQYVDSGKMLFIGGPRHGQEHVHDGSPLRFMMPRRDFEFGALADEMAPWAEDAYPFRDGTYTARKLGVKYNGDMFRRDIMVRDGLDDTRAAIELRELLVVRWIAGQALT